MNVAAAQHDPAERPNVMRDRNDQQAHAKEREKEGDGGKEHPPSRTIGDVATDEMTKLRQVQKQQQRSDDQNGKKKEYPGPVHEEQCATTLFAL